MAALQGMRRVRRRRRSVRGAVPYCRRMRTSRRRFEGSQLRSGRSERKQCDTSLHTEADQLHSMYEDRTDAHSSVSVYAFPSRPFALSLPSAFCTLLSLDCFVYLLKLFTAMPDTAEAEIATPQPAAAAAEGSSTARKRSEETKEQVTFSEPVAEMETQQQTDEEEQNAPTDSDTSSSSTNATSTIASPTHDSSSAETAASDDTATDATIASTTAADNATSIDQPKHDTEPDNTTDTSPEVPMSIRIGSPSESPPKAADGSAKAKKSTPKSPNKPAAASPKKSSTANKSSRPPSSSSSAATTARKAANASTHTPLTVAVDSTSSPPSARAAGLSVPSPSMRSSRSPRSSIVSALPSPSKQRTIEETLAYWPLPTPKDAGQPLSPLFQLVLDGRADGVLSYIVSIPIHDRLEAVNCYDGSGNSPLMYALVDGKQACLELLLDYGCDVNGVNERRNCPLHLAVHYGWKRAIHTLIEYGANIKQENWEHQQPHQMHKSTDKQQTYLTLLNAAHEATQAKVAARQLLVVEREVRCYYRAMFDLLDVDGLGVLSWYRVKAVMDVVLAERDKQRLLDNPPPVTRLTAAERDKLREKDKEVGAGSAEAGVGAAVEVDWVGKWFSELDVDHNGVLSFNEFLGAVMAWRSEQEKEQKKATGKGKKKK